MNNTYYREHGMIENDQNLSDEERYAAHIELERQEQAEYEDRMWRLREEELYNERFFRR